MLRTGTTVFFTFLALAKQIANKFHNISAEKDIAKSSELPCCIVVTKAARLVVLFLY